MSFDLSLLGVRKNIPKVNFTDYTGIFIAEPKFGKTTMASKFPNSIIVPFEDGAKGQVANVVEKLNNWDDFIEFVDKLEEYREEIGTSIQTIVFDTVNKAYDMCESYTLRKLSFLDKKNYQKPNDVPHGGFYPARDKYFSLQLDRISRLGFTMLFLSHSKVKTIRPKDGEAYDVYSSTMPERLEAIINPLVDFIIYGERRVIDGVRTRVLVTKGNEMTATGNRVYMNEDIPFESEEEAMQKYQELFRKQIENRLADEGITEDVDSIAKRQQEEKMSKVKEYLEQEKTKSVDDYKEEIDEIISNLSTEKKKELQAAFVSKVGDAKYKSSEDTEKLKKYLEVAKSVK